MAQAFESVREIDKTNDKLIDESYLDVTTT
jgi:hypothetical protein